MCQSKSPLISVIIPLYNHRDYVCDCLDSILAAAYSPVEVLIMDDGSNDGSYEAAEEWRSRHPNAFVRFVLLRQSNQGAARTCNALIRQCQGSFIAPLASDDCLLPGGLAARVQYLEQNPGLMAVMGDCIVISERSEKISESALFNYRGSDRLAFGNSESLIDELVLRWVVPGPVLLLRRETFLGPGRIGFYAEDGGIEDRDFFLRLLHRKALGFVPDKVAAYRIHVANSCRPTTPAARLAHYKSRLISERKHIKLFHRRRRMYLRLASMRFACLVARLGEGSKVARLGEVIAGAAMLALYYTAWIGRRLSLAAPQRVAREMITSATCTP